MLNDFRVENEEPLKDLLTQMLAVLIRGGLVRVTRIAQDGTRVRVGAGAKSFKRRETIERALPCNKHSRIWRSSSVKRVAPRTPASVAKPPRSGPRDVRSSV